MNLKRTLLFICIGVIFIIVGIVVLNQGNNLKKRCTEETIGTVVDIIREEDSDNTTYFPVIEYQVEDRKISQESRSGAQNRPKYRRGEQVEIYYNPDNVQEYIIKGDSTSSFVGILTIVLGSLSVIGGFIGKNS